LPADLRRKFGHSRVEFFDKVAQHPCLVAFDLSKLQADPDIACNFIQFVLAQLQGSAIDQL
jgi:hypothetical protein